MPSAPRRFIYLVQTLLVGALTCGVTQAQIHEEKPGPGLEEGLLFHSAVTAGVVESSPQKLATSETADIGTEDFTVCFWVMVHNMKHVASTLSKSSDDTGWTVNTHLDVEIRLLHPSLNEAITMRAPINEVHGAGDHHIAIVIKRDARQPLSGIWIDGVERVSAAVSPVNLSCPASPLQIQYTHPFSRLKDLRIYNRALTRPEILELTLRGKEGAGFDKPKPMHPAPPPDGPRFIPQQDETIALIGGTEAVALAESGELEALLLMAFPQTRFHFRSLAWEGDTVFRQDRPMNFGSLEQQLRRVKAGAVFVMFGRQECLDAAAGNPGSAAVLGGSSGKTAGGDAGAPSARAAKSREEFKTAFGKLLDTVAKVTPNIVVIWPPRFEKASPPLPDVSRSNDEFLRWSYGIEKLVLDRGAEFDWTMPVFDSLSVRKDNKTVLLEKLKDTRDGVQLNEDGAKRICRDLWARLSFPRRGEPGDPDRFIDLIETPSGNRLTEAVRSKNRLWHDYWRPSNWAFLHGDRTNQPSSRDPVNPQIRLFPAEQEKYLPLIKAAEDKVFQLVQEAQKKLP